jgi:hypothetical protein
LRFDADADADVNADAGDLPDDDDALIFDA